MKLCKIAFALFVLVLAGCGGSGEKKSSSSEPFCKDTTCITEPILVSSDAPGKPFVRVSFKDCKIDSIHYEKGGMGVIKDIIFAEYMPDKEIRVSKDYFKIDIVDAKYAWVKFNDCATGRGYLLKLAFDKSGTEIKLSSAINNTDKKFNVADGLVAYYDNTFIYVQDMATDKVAKQLLTDTGVKEIDFNDVHSLIDSVNITKDNIYAKLIVDGKPVEHNVPLEFN
ncbi:MAG: hypothetical protein ACK5NK_05975 [Niabella sp.]